MLIETSCSLEGRCLLVVEDEYMIAIDLVSFFEDLGADVIGPAGSVVEGLDLVEQHGHRVDIALLDVNLRGELVYPVADALAAKGVPVIFTTGYDAMVLPDPYQHARRCDKPVNKHALAQLLVRVGSRHSQA
jgi:CheY-like chemotaxis protein